MNDYNAHKVLRESVKAPELMAERKPLVFETARKQAYKGDKSNPETWSIEK